ncbi:unnamed protein product, partial [Closterium sp. NIES-64]
MCGAAVDSNVQPRAVGLRELESQQLPHHMRRESPNFSETRQHDEVSFERAAAVRWGAWGVGRQQRRSLLWQWFRDAPDGLVSAEQRTATQTEMQVGKVQAGGGGDGERASGGGVGAASGGHSAEWLLLRKEIGRGQYGVIRRCVHRSTGEHAACKSIRKSAIQHVHVVMEL